MASAITISDHFTRLKRAVQSALGVILRVATFLGVAVFGGILSSWYIASNGAAFNSKRHGPWIEWTTAGRFASDPYSLIRQDRNGMLLYSSAFVSRYEASFDDSQRRLHSACHYAIEGRLQENAWWSLNVFDGQGGLIANESNRHGFNAATIVDQPDGSFRIDLAREARPGNWIPTSRAGRLIIVLEVQNTTGDAVLPDDAQERRLPSIKRLSC
ncbi:MAG: DUF1214 domain-containing protein [Alphaproteobacteria bacterium]|nr:DUF1214 domain-containing protein [Alphaproteobacteria bacterium]